MMLDMALIQHCTPDIHPAIANAIVKTESSFNPYAIGVNRGTRLARQPTSYAQAVSIAKELLKSGANIDLGLGQINSSNLNWLRLSVEQAFDPCSNLKAMQFVYLTCLSKAGRQGSGTAMQRAFSCYNTGDTSKGFSNGYVRKATNNYNKFAKLNFSNSSVPVQPVNTPPVPMTVPMTVQPSLPITIQPSVPTQEIIQTQDLSVSVRSDDSSINQENNQDEPIKVFNTWDVFRDF